MATTMDDIAKGIREMKAGLEQLASRPASRAGINPQQVFAGFQPAGGSDTWPVEQMKRLQPYDQSAVQMMVDRRTGRPRLSGMGPALVKMAALAGHNEARQYARAAGMADSYGEDKFEEEHGFVTVAKASKFGIPWDKRPDGQRRKAALAENAGGTGGYLIPPQFQAEMLTIEAEESFIQPRCRIVPMTTRSFTWPVLDITTVQASGVSPYYGGIIGTWLPEGVLFNQTKPGFTLSEWTAWDLTMFCIASNQLLADNGVGLDAILTQLFGGAMTWYKEFAFLQGLGAGSSMPLGVLNSPATILQSRNTPGRFLLADAAAMLSHLQARSRDSACWIIHQSVLPQLIQMVDGGFAASAASASFPAGNRPMWLSPMGANGEGALAMKLPDTFLHGLPLYVTEKLPTLGTTGDVLLVDWSQYVIGQRMEIQIDLSSHFLFQTNQIAYRVVARCDGRPWLRSAITDQAGWQVSPFLALK